MSEFPDLSRDLLCFARGRPGDWEAFCADFDIAVQGRSFHEVQSEMEAAVADYIEAARQESEADRVRLLSRRAPVRLVLLWTLRVLLSAWRRPRGGDHDTAASFPVAFAT